ncbi:MAG: bifunctional diaminohydroxyphosphoribosylaminopyrimidine deaminase/5-amino-6-(5-phosphoribosylamino)uracil reductase RibD [Clostridia bacterium]|nr:bifunctional diaminohydroxyphosphoribosylaminopyrimidine deaminase/5-amino-6-(5-phosphoribosylamino)uracil reductase RibD [Clostridia bacterium]
MNYMERAIELAKKGAGFVSPNPMVGAVIVKDGRIIGEGFHEKYGSNHAEVNAFLNASEDVEGAEMYVTLEPCSHYGNTPPCAKAIVEHKIKKVYIGSLDTNPKVAGKGVEILKNGGVEVEVGIMEKECKAINPIFFKYIETGIPYVVMKSAMTLDGKISAYTGDSKWVTNEKSRYMVQELRHKLKAIMVGINTVITDNPKLTCRIENGINPIRIIVDSKLQIPLDAKVLKLKNKDRCIIAAAKGCDICKKSELQSMGAEIIETPSINNRVDLKYLMTKLGEMKIDSILLEGGGTLNFSMLQNNLVDKALFFIAPKIIGGDQSKTPVEGKGIAFMDDAIKLHNIEVKNIENDILIYGDVR